MVGPGGKIVELVAKSGIGRLQECPPDGAGLCQDFYRLAVERICHVNELLLP